MDQKALIQLLNSDHFAESIQNISYEDKIAILRSTTKDFLRSSIKSRAIEENITIFNHEESINILENNPEGNLLYLYPDYAKLLDLSDELLLEYAYYDSRVFPYLKDKSILFKNIDRVNDYFIEDVYEYLSDEQLASLLSNKQYDPLCILLNFHSDEYRMRYLHKISFYDRCSVIVKMSDENKKKYLHPLTSGRNDIIASFTDDAEKEKYLDLYQMLLSENAKAMIIASFKDKEYRHRNLKLLRTEKGRYEFFHKSRLSDIKNDYAFYEEIIKSFRNEDTIIDFFNYNNWLFDVIPQNVCTELVKYLINKIHNQDNFYFLLDTQPQFIVDMILPKVNQKTIEKFVQNRMAAVTPNDLLYLNNHSLMIYTLNHCDNNQEYDEKLRPLVEIVSNHYHLNTEHLIALLKITGCPLLSMLESQNVINTINLDEDNFQKYLKMIDKDHLMLNEDALNTILNVILNKRYGIEYPNQVQIFVNTKIAVINGNMASALDNIHNVISMIDFPSYNVDLQSFIKDLLNNDNDAFELFHQMTEEFLKTNRKEYINHYLPRILKRISNVTYELNDVIKYVMKVLPENQLIEIIEYGLKKIDDDHKYDDFKDKEVLRNLIRFRKRPNDVPKPDKYYLNIFNDLLKEVFNQNQFLTPDVNYGSDLRISYMPRIKNDLVEILTNINPQKLVATVFNDEEIYSQLLDYLKRYGLFSWGDVFKNIALQADIDISHETATTLVNNFALLMEKRKSAEARGEKMNFLSELAFAEYLGSDSYMYLHLFGRQDYLLLRQNMGPNASHRSKEYRFERALECLKVMHSRQYITVPPIDKNYVLKNGKILNIMLGNTNDTINLTYGERTGACMRIGGAGDSLFDYCLEDENGFHISYNDPQTGELVSRVSCFRNGNTLFLNQVRNSLSPSYSNDDIKEATLLLAQEIVAMTKSSKFPIENVVTSPFYAFDHGNSVRLDVDPSLICPNVYNDIGDMAVPLTGKLVPVKLGTKNAERYAVGRCHVKKCLSTQASDALAHIEVLDAYLSGISIDEIKLDFKDIVLAYAGEDWYVAINFDGQIISYIAKMSRNREAAQAELTSYLEKMKAEMDILNAKKMVK